jgi:hypothetical protein
MPAQVCDIRRTRNGWAHRQVKARQGFEAVGEGNRALYAAIGGAGELSSPFIIVSPPSIPLLLCSLGRALLPIGFASLEPVESLLTSPANVRSLVGAFQEGMPHIMPVKDLIWMPLRSHLRQGLPLRSRARRPALMAPVLAFGPSLCAGTGLGVLVLSPERSIEPSGLWLRLAYGVS